MTFFHIFALAKWQHAIRQTFNPSIYTSSYTHTISDNMKTICYVVAMVAEAKPFIDRYGIKKVDNFFSPLPCQLYEGEVGGARLCVVLNGQMHGSDLVGCEAASVATMAAIQRLDPDIIINSGTCGAFSKHGAQIAEVYIGN